MHNQNEMKWIIALVVGITIVLLLTLYFFFPLLDGLIMGIVFSYVARPIKNKLEKRLGIHLSSLIAVIIILIPIAFLMFYGLFQGINQLIYVLTHQEDLEGMISKMVSEAGISDYYIQTLLNYLPNLIEFIRSKLELLAFDIAKQFVMFVINFFISGIVCYYALLDGGRFIRNVISIIPQNKRVELEKFLNEVDETFLGLWFGNFMFAIIIGLASIPFFLYFNVPFTSLLSGLMFLAALIPIFAEWMVLVPVTLYLVTKDPNTAIWFIVIGFVFLYFIPEVILRPYLVGYTSKIHPLVLMLAFIGGGIVGGILGFFLAPMIAGILTALYNHYTR